MSEYADVEHEADAMIGDDTIEEQKKAENLLSQMRTNVEKTQPSFKPVVGKVASIQEKFRKLPTEEWFLKPPTQSSLK